MRSQKNEYCLPLPPPIVPRNVRPEKIEQEHVKKKLLTNVPMARRGLGTTGNKLSLLTNHFKVNAANTDGCFYQYNVCNIFH